MGDHYRGLSHVTKVNSQDSDVSHDYVSRKGRLKNGKFLLKLCQLSETLTTGKTTHTLEILQIQSLCERPLFNPSSTYLYKCLVSLLHLDAKNKTV